MSGWGAQATRTRDMPGAILQQGWRASGCSHRHELDIGSFGNARPAGMIAHPTSRDRRRQTGRSVGRDIARNQDKAWPRTEGTARGVERLQRGEGCSVCPTFTAIAIKVISERKQYRNGGAHSA